MKQIVKQKKASKKEMPFSHDDTKAGKRLALITIYLTFLNILLAQPHTRRFLSTAVFIYICFFAFLDAAMFTSVEIVPFFRYSFMQISSPSNPNKTSQ